MLSNGGLQAAVFCILSYSVLCSRSNSKFDITKDQTTSRANTLFDDADDIQRQLDNEVRDRYGQFKTVWVFHVPSHNNLQSISHTTAMNDFSVRLKRKPDKTRYTIFKKYLDTKEKEKPSETNEKSCTCDENGDETPSKPCMCRPNCTQCEEDPNCEKPNIDPESVAEPHEAPNPQEPEWHFWNQNKWYEKFKDCGGHAQSPVNLPVEGLIHGKGARKLIFSNYDVQANNLTVVNDGKRVVMYGNWPKHKWPLVYGGAAHSRRYLFHSLTVYWPSEHPVGGLYYPMETQLLHISAEYCSYDEAIKAAPKDPMAFLGVVNIYKFAKVAHPGLMSILEAAHKCRASRAAIKPMALENFSAPFKDYVCYYGSLTVPPCTEAVLWLVRRRSLPVTREAMGCLQDMLSPATPPANERCGDYVRLNTRAYQPLNDRKVYIFS